MAQLTRVTDNGSAPADTTPEYDEDGGVSLTLSGGRQVVFRGPTVGDIRAVRSAMRSQGIPIDDPVEAAVRIAARCCTKWGDQPNVNLNQIDELSFNDFTLINVALAPFVGESQG